MPTIPKPPKGVANLLATFGNPLDKDYAEKHIVNVKLPFKIKTSWNSKQMMSTIQVHYLLKDLFMTAMNASKPFINDCGGAYCLRLIRGSEKNLSMHSYGIAIDLNVKTNPLGGVPKQPAALVKIWKDLGFFWGGDYKKRKDGMHFEYRSY